MLEKSKLVRFAKKNCHFSPRMESIIFVLTACLEELWSTFASSAKWECWTFKNINEVSNNQFEFYKAHGSAFFTKLTISGDKDQVQLCHYATMARTPRNATGDMVYHVLNRANERMQIFRKDKDYQAFVDLLRAAKEKYPMRILTYCLMPNHWHLLLYPALAWVNPYSLNPRGRPQGK